jgi:hypothetical protein
MANTHAIRPEDIIPDGLDKTILNGTEVRKGTIAAFIANIELLEAANASIEQQSQALQMLKELAPAVVAIGLPRHVVFNNAQAKQVLIDAGKKQ